MIDQTGDILGVSFHPCTYREVIYWLQPASPKRPVRVVCVANVADVMTARKDREYREALASASLVVPDGMPIVWALRQLGFDLHDRVYGPELMARVLHYPEHGSWRHGMIGASASARNGVRNAFASVNWVGEAEPWFNELDEAGYRALAEEMNSWKADVLWVALGGGKQVLFMHRIRPYLRQGTLIGVGAAFDFHAGLLPQAPAWMQRRGLESVFRFLCEPRRLWRRYLLLNPPFFWYWWRGRRQS